MTLKAGDGTPMHDEDTTDWRDVTTTTTGIPEVTTLNNLEAKKSSRFSFEVVDSDSGEVLIERWRVKSACVNPFIMDTISFEIILLEAEPLRILNDKLCNKLLDFVVEFYDANGHYADGLIYKNYRVDVESVSKLYLDYEDEGTLDLRIVAKRGD